MSKKSVYFIYIVPKYQKEHSIYIEYPNNKENYNEILNSEEYNDLVQKKPLIKNLNVINLELNKKEEIKFKFNFKAKEHNYESKEFTIPKNSCSLFIYNLSFEASGYFYKDIPNTKILDFEEQYFIFKNKMKDIFLYYPDIEYNFINHSLNEMKKNNNDLNFLIFLDLISKCYELPIFNEFLNLFSKIPNIISKQMKIKEYKDLIDKLSSNEFENKFISNEEKKKNIRYLHQIILIFYYKIEEYDKFKEDIINKNLISELNYIKNFFPCLDSEIISLIIDNDKIITYQFISQSLMKSKNLEELLIIIKRKLDKIVGLSIQFQEKFKIENIKISKDDNIEKIVELYIDCYTKQGKDKRIILDEYIWFFYIYYY